MIIIISSSTCYNRILYLVRRIGIKFPETERTLRSLSAAHIPGTDLTLLGSNREASGGSTDWKFAYLCVALLVATTVEGGKITEEER